MASYHEYYPDPAHQPPKGNSLQNSYGPETAIKYGTDPEFTTNTPYEAVPEVVPAVAPNYKHPPEPQPPATSSGKSKRILGLPVGWFWAAVAAIVVVMCVAMGVGLGVGLSNNSKSSSSNSSSDKPPDSDSNSGDQKSSIPTTEPTSSSSSSSTSVSSEAPSATSSAVTSGTTGMADNSCDFDKPKTYTLRDGVAFVQYCYTDWPRGADTEDGKGKVEDLERTIVYTFEDCMRYCADYNDDLGSGDDDTKCRAVTYNSNLTSIVTNQDGNCFLKNKRGVYFQGSAESASAALVPS